MDKLPCSCDERGIFALRIQTPPSPCVVYCCNSSLLSKALRSVITQELISPLVAMLEKEFRYGSRWAGNATGRRTTVQVDCRDGGHHRSIHGHPRLYYCKYRHPTPAIGLWRGTPECPVGAHRVHSSSRRCHAGCGLPDKSPGYQTLL